MALHKFESNWFQKSQCVTWKKFAPKVPVWHSTFILQEGKIREPKLKKGLLVLRGSTFTASSQYANVIWRYGQNQAEGGSQGLHCCVLTKYCPVIIQFSVVLYMKYRACFKNVLPYWADEPITFWDILVFPVALQANFLTMCADQCFFNK